MKRLLIFSFFLFSIFACYTQDINYAYVDRTILAIPPPQTHTTSDIADYIKAHFDTDNKKVRAAYTWVAANIRYNRDSLHPVIFEEDRALWIASTLRRRKGVCENYASVFNDICLKSGLRSLLVEGFTRQNGSLDRSPHAWCAVYANKNWYLYDPTWDEARAYSGAAAGNINYNYFQVSPEIFIQSHMPFDPMFQLLNYPLTYKEFYNGNTRTGQNRLYFNYADSIALFEKSDLLDRYRLAVSRMERNGKHSSDMITNKMKQLKMDIEIIYQDNDTTLYNAAVADYNDARSTYNTFLNYRNNRFTPAKTDTEVGSIFEHIQTRIASAKARVQEINSSKASMALGTDALEKVLDDLTRKTKEQQDFLKEYQSSARKGDPGDL